MAKYQARNRLEMSVDTLHNVCGAELIDSSVTATVDTTSLQDTKNLYKGGTDHYAGRQVVIYDSQTSAIVDGETATVASSSSTVCTVSPAFSAAPGYTSTSVADHYLLIPIDYSIEQVYNAISQAIDNASTRVYNDKVTTTAYTEWDRENYDVLSSFTHLSKVEYVSSIGDGDVIADGLWTAATGATASSDTELYRGRTCSKVVDASVGAGAQIAYFATGTKNLSNYDTLELWVRASVAQAATKLEINLCSDTLGATPVDTVSLPALTIDTWTRVQLTMTNPESDTAIASISLDYQAGQSGACTYWIEYAYGLKASSRKYAVLSPERWGIARSSTKYLKIRPGLLPNDALLRLTGYQLLTRLTDNTTDADIDPAYIVNSATASMLNNSAVALDLDVRRQRAAMYELRATRLLRLMETHFAQDTVEV